MASEWCVYIVECADGSLYTGITNDLQRRLDAHNRGVASRYTRARLPVVLRYHEPHLDRSSASKREAAIKKLPRAQKDALVTAHDTRAGLRQTRRCRMRRQRADQK